MQQQRGSTRKGIEPLWVFNNVKAEQKKKEKKRKRKRNETGNETERTSTKKTDDYTVQSNEPVYSAALTRWRERDKEE
jgi:hypothetical protein